MKEFLTRQFSIAEVALALQTAFRSDFFQSEDKIAVVESARIVDSAGQKGEIEEIPLLGAGAQYVERRQIEVTWARVDPNNKKR